MLRNISRGQVAGLWIGAVILLGACATLVGAAVTVSNVELLMATGLVPPAVMWLVWRGAPPLTVAEVLHSVDRTSPKGRS
jgi:hypothetical protein